MGSARRWGRCLLGCVVVASCGFPRPPDILPDGADGATSGSPYQLLSITPAIATAGDTLTMEGTFATDAMVQFPGGVTQAAVVLGEHRATVVVPETATVGDLTVTTGGLTLGPLTFRRTSFALGLQPFRVSYEQTDCARQSPTLRIARSSATSAVVNGWLYVVGGDNGNGPVNSIERAPTNADGTIGAFDLVSDVSLLQARSGHSSVVVGGTLFVIAGSGSTRMLNSVEHAAINSDGILGPFMLDTGTALVTPRTGHVSVVIGNSLFVIGGTRSDGSKLDSIERAIIQRDGSLGPFASVDAALSIPRSGHTAEVIGNELYVLGGNTTGGIPSSSVERASIGADGSLGTFSSAPGVMLSAPRTGHRSAVLSGVLYVLGGSGSGGVIASVESAAISMGGSLGPFAAYATALSTARTGHTMALIGNWTYMIGGRNTGNPTATVERANINADGALSAFADLSVSTVQSREHSAITAIRDSIYVIGRSGSATTIERAILSPDGSATVFRTVAGISTVMGRSSHTLALAGNYLYAIGGDLAPSSIERAVVNLDGSLGSFTTVPITLNEARSGHVSIILNNFLYVISGLGAVNHTRLTSVERAVLGPDGTLGTFTTISGVALNTGRNYASVVVTDRYLYIIGGLDDVNLGTANVERAAIGPDGSLGQFSVVGPLFKARGAHTNTVVGNTLYVVGGLAAAGQVTSVERAIINADGSLGTFGPIPSLTEDRSRHTALSTSGSLYLIGGVTGQASGGTADVLTLGHADLR